MPSFKIKDYNFHYAAEGQGTPLIFLHDGLLHSVGWRGQIEHFKTHFFVVTYDRRGYGKNDLDGNPYSDEEDLLALMTYLNIKQATLVGCSNGARLALNFVIHFPERVSRMILVAPALPGYMMSASHQKRVSFAMEPLKRSKDVKKSIQRWKEDLYYVHPKAKKAKAFLEKSLLDNPHNLTNMGRFKNRRDEEVPLEALGYVGQKTLILVGEDDSEDSIERAEICKGLLVNSELLKLPKMAHLPHLEKADVFNRHAEAFLKKD